MDNNDFEIVGRISIDDSGSVKLEATNNALNKLDQEAGKLSSTLSKLGEMTQYVFGELLLQGVLAAGKALFNFLTQSVQAAQKHQDIMAQFNATIDSQNAALGRTADATGVLNKVQGQLETVTAGSTKEITKAQKALDSAKKSLDTATASYDLHAKHTAAATAALQAHQQKVVELQGQYDKLTKTSQVYVTVQDGVKRTISATAAAVTMTKDQLVLMADSFAKTTIYSKDMQLQAETTILQFDRIGKDVFPLAMQASEDLAAKFKIDLSQAAEYVGRALGDPAAGVGILQRQFQLFEPTQLKAIENMAKQGKTAEAQKAILDALAISISGSSTAAARTFSGQMQIFNNSLEEAKIKVGTALIPALTALMEKLSPMADKVLPLFGDALTKVVVPAFGWVLQKAGEFLDWINKVGGPVDTVKNAISDLVSKGLAALGNWWNTNGPGITKFFTDLGTAIGNIPPTISGIASNLKTIFLDAFSKIDPATLDSIKEFITRLATGLHNIPNTISTIASALVTIFTTAFNNVAPKVLQAVSDFIRNLGDGIRNIPNTIGKIAADFQAFAGAIKDYATNLVNVDPRAIGFLVTGIMMLGTVLLVAKIPTFIEAITAALALLDTTLIPTVIAMLPLILIIGIIAVITLLAATNFHGFGDALAKVNANVNNSALITGLREFRDGFLFLADAAMAAYNAIKLALDLLGITHGSIQGDPGKVRAAAGQIAAAMAAARGSPGYVASTAAPTGAPGKAAGGPVERGRPYMVGEKGPEVFVPGQSGYIIPNATSHSIVNNYYFGQTLYNPQQEQGQNMAQAFRKS